MNTDLHFSSKQQDWRTPPSLFNSLQTVFHFTLDAAASSNSALCPRYFSPENSALAQDWHMPDGGAARVWLNPPYGREQPRFIRKAAEELASGNAACVMFLIPARPDTKAWQEIIFPQATAICWMRGRIKFGTGASGQTTDPAPFASALVYLNSSALEDAQRAVLMELGAVTESRVVRRADPLEITAVR